MDPEALKVAGAHWSNRTVKGRPNWWQHPPVVEHVNRLICGRPVSGIAGGDLAVLRGRRFGEGVSVGCGDGYKEMVLLRAGIVEHFQLFEIAEKRVERGREEAVRLGLSDRITWHQEPANFSEPVEVDLVYWNNALHHMLGTESAVAWSRRSLRSGGTFYMNDFVGPDRMQWSREMLDAASEVRASLPERLIGNDTTRIQRPNPDHMMDRDPTECADSAAILPALRGHFPGASARLTGGVVYQVALKGLLDRFTDEEPLWPRLLEADRHYVEQGLSTYAVCHT